MPIHTSAMVKFMPQVIYIAMLMKRILLSINSNLIEDKLQRIFNNIICACALETNLVGSGQPY